MPTFRAKAKQKKRTCYINTRKCAPEDGNYAVIVNGRREVLFHKSGEPYKGEIPTPQSFKE